MHRPSLWASGHVGVGRKWAAVRWLWVTFRPFHACASRTISLIFRGEHQHIDSRAMCSEYHFGRGCCWSKLVGAPQDPVRLGTVSNSASSVVLAWPGGQLRLPDLAMLRQLVDSDPSGPEGKVILGALSGSPPRATSLSSRRAPQGISGISRPGEADVGSESLTAPLTQENKGLSSRSGGSKLGGP